MDFSSPGGGTGALIVMLTHLIPHYNTMKYLVEIDTGELFGWIANQCRCTGLYCSTQPFVINELTAMTTCCGAALQMDLEQQTSVIQLSGAGRDNMAMLPPLPLMPGSDAYIQQPDVMTPNMRINYVRDKKQAALTYITEYETAQQ